MNFYIKLILSAAYFLCCSIAFAQAPGAQRSEGISYISGGVGEEESQAILMEAKQWPLFLELSQLENGRGVWIFGAKIKIQDAKNQVVFDAQADGPYVLINLSPGQYQIEASYQGVVQKRSVLIQAATPQKLSIFWK